jgi:hypothetical protein
MIIHVVLREIKNTHLKFLSIRPNGLHLISSFSYLFFQHLHLKVQSTPVN